MLYAFFWVIPQRLEFICRRFGTLCLFHLHRQVDVRRIYLHMKMEQSVLKRRHIKSRRRGNYPKESIQHVAICLGGVAISTNVFQHISQSCSRSFGCVECNCLPPVNVGCVCGQLKAAAEVAVY